MNFRHYAKLLAKSMLAAAIMPWIGFAMIAWLIFPMIMLFAAPLLTVKILYGLGFVPSMAAAMTYYIFKHYTSIARKSAFLLVGLTALAGGVYALLWASLLGLAIDLRDEPGFLTIVAIAATGLYFAIKTIASRTTKCICASLIQKTAHLP